MRIESLKTEPDRAGRFWVTLEDGTKLALYRQTVEDFGLYAGMELSDPAYESLLDSAGTMSARMRAVRIVAASAVSKKDLQQRLIQKGEDPQKAAQAASWMEDLHLVDDADTARQLVNRCAARGYGLARAKQVLYEKKIPKELWADALAGYPDQSDSILSFLRSRLAGDFDGKAVKRATDALLRRGHSYSDIRKGLAQLSLEAEDIPEDL